MRIGFLGIGNMGRPMAGKLLDAGHELWVYDIRDEAMQPLLERQARKASSLKDLADTCDTVVVSLPTLAIFRQALEELLTGGALKTLVNTCTVGGPFIGEVERLCAERDVTVIDAPISGGPAGAAAGTLAVMVSGDPATVEALQPVFRAWGPTVVVAGETPGAGQTMKLTNNILFAVGLVAASEAMTMAEKGGIAPETMLQVLNNGTGRNFSTAHVFPANIVPGTFDFGATLEILMKDVNLAIEQGEALGVPMWVCQAARLVMLHGKFQGRAGQDLSRIVEIVRDGTKEG